VMVDHETKSGMHHQLMVVDFLVVLSQIGLLLMTHRQFNFITTNWAKSRTVMLAALVQVILLGYAIVVVSNLVVVDFANSKNNTIMTIILGSFIWLCYGALNYLIHLSEEIGMENAGEATAE